MQIFPNAKINIGLYITSKRSDGYHNLETIMYPIPLHDVLEIKPLKEGTECDVQIIGMPKGEEPENNLVYRVYDSLRKEFGLPPVAIYLKKNIPTGAGLGGGSSDATATMRLLNEMFSLDISPKEMEQRMATFGADCPFFVCNRAAFASETGTTLQPVSLCLKGLFVLLVKPHESVSTREAYAAVRPQSTPNDLRESVMQPIKTWRAILRNDFEQSVFPQHPGIDAIKSTLYDMGAIYAQMSGSGSCVFGIFDRPTPEGRRIFTDCYVYNKELR